MKKISKDAIGHFKVLVDHSLRDHEPTRIHVLKRMVRPLCEDFNTVLQEGTKNDAWIVLQGFSKECKKAFKR